MDVNAQSQLQAWQAFYDSTAGASVLESEEKLLRPLLATLHGECLLQIGGPDDPALLRHSPILHKVQLSCAVTDTSLLRDLCGSYVNLPIATFSMDVVLVYHVLESQLSPQLLFDEVHRVLKGEGTIVLLCFHAHSLWGIQHLWKQQGVPWDGHFYSIFKLQRYLAKAGFIHERHKTMHYRPFSRNKERSRSMRFIEPVGQLCWPFCGAVSLVTAIKRVSHMTEAEDALYGSELAT